MLSSNFYNFPFLELRGHLKKLQSLAVQIPEMVIESFVRDHSDQTDVVVGRIKKENDETVATLENQRVCEDVKFLCILVFCIFV